MRTIKYFISILAITTMSFSCSKKGLEIKPEHTEEVSIAFTPSVGGPNEPNQVFVDLSQKKEHLARRDAWSLGFNNGEGFNVILNYNIYTTTLALDATDIDAVKEADIVDLKQALSGHMGSPDYIDDPSGDLTKTAIRPISAKAEENKVYLLYLGNSIPTDTPTVGQKNVSGASLGYRKIRVLRKENGYLLQYAELNATRHKEVFIPKGDKAYSFTYFDLLTEKVVKVEPKKTDWDLCFTVFSNKTITNDGSATYSYSYSDFILSNTFGGVKVFVIYNSDEKLEGELKTYADMGLLKQNTFLTYEKFDKKKLVVFKDKLKAARTLPGSIWRNVFSGKTHSNLYFLIQDPEGQIYKLKLTQMVNQKGERGYPGFEYQLLK